MQKRLTEKYSTEVAKYHRIYRDLSNSKVHSNTDVRANSVLRKNIERSSRYLSQLNTLLFNVDNKVVRVQTKGFTRRLSSLLAEQDEMDNEMNDIKKRINHLKSQIERVDVKLEKYSAVDNHFDAEKKIETLENRLLRNNQKVNGLRLHGIKLKDIVSELLFMRRRFQKSRDDITAMLMVKKQEITELVDHYAIGFANGMKNCRNLEACHIRSTRELKAHLQEMRQLIRSAESNNILREFMITKATPIELSSDAIPPREILKSNYRKLTQADEELLSKIGEFASGVTASGLKSKVREAYSLYLYSNDITKMIDNSAKMLETLEKQSELAEIRLLDRQQNEHREKELENQWTEEATETQRHSTNLADNESMLVKCYKDVREIFETLQCEDSLLYEVGQSIDGYNVHAVLRVIETRLRHVMYTVSCWQEKNNVPEEERLVHGIEIVKAHGLPLMEMVHPCPECSQIEARANPDVEAILDKKTKSQKIKSNIKMHNMRAKMHNIQDCPKPGSKSVLSKTI
ncbi:uncharacterized protein LOC129579556 [Sitodiplosis mosellana]|uniref:uncharacterized protein LOC129579556 n=1 Tax=Sitodiplosis mosellana TaxID=263140 RepID=UPI0024440498|nr:uncharacterized protein LOC129579556 [Sitodiplosis mosellana]